MEESWKSDLERWLAPFLDTLRHKVRARMCPAYVAGLIGAGDRKSVQPMAARDGGVGYDQLEGSKNLSLRSSLAAFRASWAA